MYIIIYYKLSWPCYKITVNHMWSKLMRVCYANFFLQIALWQIIYFICSTPRFLFSFSFLQLKRHCQCVVGVSISAHVLHLRQIHAWVVSITKGRGFFICFETYTCWKKRTFAKVRLLTQTSFFVLKAGLQVQALPCACLRDQCVCMYKWLKISARM